MGAFNLPDLNYDYDALEPYVDKLTMETHHSKHHAGYTKKLNAALEGHTDLETKSIEELLKGLDDLPEEIRTAVRNNGGGYYNHKIFWEIMTPEGSELPEGKLSHEIEKTFGGVETLKEKFSEKAGSVFGSGWAWLVRTADDDLEIVSTPNQDNPIMSSDVEPILGIDVWEHAYYLKYQNRRPEYIDNWWKVVNWEEVARRFEE